MRSATALFPDDITHFGHTAVAIYAQKWLTSMYVYSCVVLLHLQNECLTPSYAAGFWMDGLEEAFGGSGNSWAQHVRRSHTHLKRLLDYVHIQTTLL